MCVIVPTTFLCVLFDPTTLAYTYNLFGCFLYL